MWAHVVNAALGIWLMAAPGVFGYAQSTPATVDRFAGPVIATFAIVAWWEATRATGRWNVALGAWLVVSPWILGYEPTAAIVNSMACGAVIAALSLVMGDFNPSKYGGGWKSLWQRDPLHEQRDRAGAGEVVGRSSSVKEGGARE
ncbi:MAG: hypothetical protein BRD47_03325 [Bacteroidetes bacterium QS_8_68_28]|nr:MAG: hypothetical protein BRD47_03325 [Bacteroidetes bacterium QS_8_68_28]